MHRWMTLTWGNRLLALCHLRSPRAATLPRQWRDGRVLQKLPGQKQDTTRQLQQVSCFAACRLPRSTRLCRWVGGSVGHTSPGSPSCFCTFMSRQQQASAASESRRWLVEVWGRWTSTQVTNKATGTFFSSYSGLTLLKLLFFLMLFIRIASLYRAYILIWKCVTAAILQCPHLAFVDKISWLGLKWNHRYFLSPPYCQFLTIFLLYKLV